MKKSLLYLPLLVFLVFILKSCSYENPMSVSDVQINQTGVTETDEYQEKIFIANIILSDNTVVGSLGVFKQLDRLSFEFTLNGPKYVKNLHFGYSLLSMTLPLSGNCPNVNNFQIHKTNLPVGTRKYVINLPKSIFTVMPRDTYTLYGAAELELESATDHPDCTYAWVAGSNFANCGSFAKYFLMKEISWYPKPLP